ncbi:MULTISPECIES: fibronectin type III domain-containing protein [Marinobacter]|uniref:Fibronectin type III domain-containing protein n=1 Tax=Marinobacter xiaoshiensis TaxID=3073652 RepID=A0ABU2HBS8_9GAMM|nr:MULTISPECIES: fibronectin type III domain-containing protein [unclassified Marinobacter]MDS1308541.1 fibronectin type III domain-containing protein [Marinobacter sp. F60267]
MKRAMPYRVFSRRSRFSLLACLQFITLISTLWFLTGCQEDDRATRTTAARASELANSRVDAATGGLLETLGQKPPTNTSTDEVKPPKALSWSAPQTREDGSALKPGQIAGFRIYYRLRHEDSFSVIPVDNPERTSQPLTDLAPGAYEFEITTVDAEGLESRRSEPVLVDLI